MVPEGMKNKSTEKFRIKISQEKKRNILSIERIFEEFLIILIYRKFFFESVLNKYGFLENRPWSFSIKTSIKLSSLPI